MQTTHTMPDGQRVRTQSQRRFVLWRRGLDARWWIVRRSDSSATLLKLKLTEDVVTDGLSGGQR